MLVKRTDRHSRGFSLIEVVIVVVIIAIIAAIALPRMSRGSAGAADSALGGNLRVLRSALDLYSTEHGGSFPTLAELPDALTKYSNELGTTFSATKNGVAGVVYGPYLRDVPPLPVGSAKGKKAFTSTLPGAGTAPADANAGWYYDPASGTIRANCADGETDARGTSYFNY